MTEVVYFVAGSIFSGVSIWYILKQKNDIQIEAIANEANIKLTSLQNIIAQNKEHYEDKIKTIQNTKEQMKQEFENLSNKVFKNSVQESNENLTLLLKPFKEQLSSFGSRVNEIYSDETKQRSSLLTEIKNLKELNLQIGEDTLNLTKALKGENKLQGDWGEMILSKILEQSGLKEDREYSVQNSYQNDDGKRLRPDVVLHLPNEKDIIIDSKVSLVSYIKVVNAQDEEGQNLAIKELMLSLNRHIKDLSSKKYEDLEELKTLDFVLMFIPIEGAFMLASSNEELMFKTAFENNVLLVSPSTLFITLRTIENMWKIQYQNENAELISKKAADLYDKFAGFIEDIENIGKHIDKTKSSYELALNKLSTGRGNLIDRVEEFKTLGVKSKKNITINEKEKN
ncbi:MAG: DNA recombination protein RmuC [Campylobacterota bacterium]|nr:DNA recombination protein RmuC [Campylobacterota bacterium]